jgi:hypothetical protein
MRLRECIPQHPQRRLDIKFGVLLDCISASVVERLNLPNLNQFHRKFFEI